MRFRVGRVVVFMLLVVAAVPCFFGCSGKEAERQRQAEIRATRNEAKREKEALDDAVTSLRQKIGFLSSEIGGIDSRFIGDDTSRYTAKARRDLAEATERRQVLRRQLDYIEAYGKMPPDSFFQDESGP